MSRRKASALVVHPTLAMTKKKKNPVLVLPEFIAGIVCVLCYRNWGLGRD